MSVASSRARVGDLKSMHASCSRATLPHGCCSCAGPTEVGIASTASLASLVAAAHTHATPHPPTSAAAPPLTSAARSYKSVGLACEVKLAEAVARSRVADRLLRGGASRTEAEGAVDRSISALAVAVFETLHAAQHRPLGASLHAQLVVVLEQLVWSEQTRLVSKEEEAKTQQPATLAKSASSLALNKAAPVAAAAPPALERLTHYELNLLHARNDASWRSHVGTLSDHEAELTERLANCERENTELRADILTFAREAQQSKDRQRELERSIQSLDGRLHIAQMAYDEQAARLAATHNFAGEQQELALQARQEIAALRTEASASKDAWNLNEATEVLRAKVFEAEKAVLAAEEQTASVNVLYYALMQSCHKAIMKKDQLATELDAAKKEVALLSQTRAEILRPYTPRPDWRTVLRAHPCELTPTLLSTSSAPTSDQIHTILTYLTQKDVEIASISRALDETMEVQNETKKDLIKSKRDLEIAIRTGMQRGQGGNGNAAAGEEAPRPRMGMSSLYVKPKSTSRYFVSLGTGKEVPPYLRANGKVRNRHLSKKDCELVVREVWARKQAHDKERGRLDLNLSDFFHFWLKHKYGLPSLVAEWGYSMLDALERYRWDADCELFLKILCGELAEEAFYDQQHMMACLTHLFMTLEVVRSERKASALVPGAVVKELPMEYISKALRLLYPAKEESAFEAICSALAQEFAESPKSREDYGLLFRENRTLNETGFIEEVRDQHLYELENFMITFTEQVVLLPREEDDEQTDQPDHAGEGRVRIHAIHNAWIRLDPQTTVDSMNRYIARALRLPPGVAVEPTTLVPPNEFCQNLFAMSLVKFTNNFDPAAVAKLAALPLPDLLPTAAQTPANASVAAAAAAAAAAASPSNNPNAAAAAEGDKKTSKANRRGTYDGDLSQSMSGKIPSPTAATAGTGDAQQAQASSKSKKDASSVSGGVGLMASFTNPKLLRLRARFGLDLRPEETPTGAVFERGPNFLDGCLKTSDKEVETLLTEKTALDEARTNERTKAREQAERSAQAIQGIGVIKRRDCPPGDKPPTSSQHDDKIISTSSSRASLVSSASMQLSPSAVPTVAAPATDGPPVDGHLDPSAPAPASVVTFELNGLELPPQSAAAPFPPANSPPIASPRGRKLGASRPSGEAADLRYKSSFFSPPEVHAATASHEPPTGGVGALGSMVTPAALKRQRRRSIEMLEADLSSSPAAIALTTAAPATDAAADKQLIH